MYVISDWLRCKCGNTNCLFKARKIKGIVKVSGKCKVCYLEDCKMKNLVWYVENRKAHLKRSKELREQNKKEYNKQARGYYQKYRLKQLAQKKAKYIPRRKETIGTLIRKKNSIRMVTYTKGII